LFICRYQYYLSGDRKHLREEQRISNKRNDSRESAKWEALLANSELCDRGVVLFGAGKNMNYCLDDMAESGVSVRAVCDSDGSKTGLEKSGYTIKDPSTAIVEHGGIPIVVTPTDGRHKQEILTYLANEGIPRESVLEYNMMNDGNKQYFGPEFMQPAPEEFYIDAGCYDGKTILDFFEFTGGEGKVYGFEPDPTCYGNTLDAISTLDGCDVTLFPKGLWSVAGTQRFSSKPEVAGSNINDGGDIRIDTVALDDIVGESDRITMVKMDIEGAELDALKGGARAIRSNAPRLAISIYHKPEDIVEIPLFILSLNPGYKFYIRHHVPWLNNETILYAIP
jgi:FkbM family methyltransferase